MLKSNLSFRSLVLSASLLALWAGAASPARAGFEWISPDMAASQGSGMSPPSASRSGSVRSHTLDEEAPFVIDGGATSRASSKGGPDGPVSGFADNVPLSVALRQILPSSYSFSLDQGVDSGVLVSWRGGSSWRDTLRDMLSVAGLGMQEDGMTVRISYATDAAPASHDGGGPLPLGPSSLGTPLDQQYATIHHTAPVADVPARRAASVPFNGGGAPAMASSAVGGQVDTWTAEKGDTLRKALENWSRKAGVDLVWQAEYDFPLQASVALSGTFEEAVRNLLSGFQDARPQPIGALHNGAAAGQAVLVIQTRGNNYSG